MKPNRSNTLVMTIVAIAALVQVAFAPSASAQQYNPTTLSITNVVPATSTNSAVAGVVPVLKHDLVAIQATLKLQGSGTSPVVLYVYESLDGTTYSDTAAYTLSITPAGTTQKSGVLRISPGAVGYLKINTIDNPNATAVTNLVVKYTYKPQRSG